MIVCKLLHYQQHLAFNDELIFQVSYFRH